MKPKTQLPAFTLLEDIYTLVGNLFLITHTVIYIVTKYNTDGDDVFVYGYRFHTLRNGMCTTILIHYTSTRNNQHLRKDRIDYN